MIYKVYIDDSGSRNYENPYSKDFVINPPGTDKYLEYWRKNYFVLTGVRVSLSHINNINTEINSLKTKFFKTNDVEIKSDWLRNPYKRKNKYLNPHKISEDMLNNFGNKLFDLISSHQKELKIISVVFDKRCYGDRKRNMIDGDPLAKSSQILFERIHYLGGENTVIFDQMDSSLKINRGDNKLVFKIYKENSCMKQLYVENFSSIIDVTPADSSKENFLQIADLCGYPIYRQFVHFGRQWGNPDFKIKSYPYFEKLWGNFVSIKEKVRGIGLICVPDIHKKTPQK